MISGGGMQNSMYGGLSSGGLGGLGASGMNPGMLSQLYMQGGMNRQYSRMGQEVGIIYWHCLKICHPFISIRR